MLFPEIILFYWIGVTANSINIKAIFLIKTEIVYEQPVSVFVQLQRTFNE